MPSTDPGVRPRSDAARVPEGTRLLHIGPHKTGTTAVQSALWNARPELLAQGVRHVGRSRNPSAAAQAVVARPSPYSVDQPPSIGRWRELVREIRRAKEPRVVVSSEYFAWATDDVMRRVAADLDVGRLHIVVTMRPLAQIIPSMWQQNVQQGTVTPFEDWVGDVLRDRARGFWLLQRHDHLVERWRAVVGRERVTAVVVDDQDHGAVMRAFEGLLGLRNDTLVPERDLANRSLTRAEAEAVRAFNVAFNESALPRDLHARVMRFGAAQLMKQRVPAGDEPAVTLPTWALDDVTAVEEEMVANLRASGVAVIGDLDSLLRRPAAPSMDAAIDRIPAEVVASMSFGLLTATGAVRTAAVSRGPFKYAEPAEMTRVPTYQLFGALVGRTWRATAGRLPLPAPRRKST